MRIIKNNFKPIVKVEIIWPIFVKCDICKSHLNIEKEDITTEVSQTDGVASKWITCPCCDNYTMFNVLKSNKDVK